MAKCTRDHGGNYNLSEVRRGYYECAGCSTIYTHAEVKGLDQPITVESSYVPARGQYRLDGVVGGQFPTRVWYDSDAQMFEAVQNANPYREVR